MEKFFSELEEFQNLLDKFEKQISELNKDNDKRKAEYNEFKAEYNEMIKEEALTGEPIDKDRLNGLTRKIKNRERDFQQIDDRIEATKEARSKILGERLPGLKEAYHEMVININKEIRKELSNIIPAALPYLKHLQKIGGLNQKRSDAFNNFMAAAKVIDNDYENKHFRFSTGERVNLSLTGDSYHGVPPLGLTIAEQESVITNGELPFRHALYELTSEIETDNRKAKQKYYKEMNMPTEEEQQAENEKELSLLQKEIKELEKKRTDVMYKRDHESYKELSREINKLTEKRAKLRGLK